MKFKKAFGLLLAIIMVFGLAVPTMAEDEEATTTEATETETVTLHKMMFHPEDAKGNASITDKWTQTNIDAMKDQDNYETDQDFASEVDRLQKLMNAIPEGQTKAIPKWSGYIGQDANGKYILYKGEKINNYDKFFGQGVTEAAGVYFQWFNKKNEPLKVTYDANSTDKYTIAVASAEEASTLPSLPALSTSREAGKTYLMAGLTTDHGIVFPTKGMKGDYEIREIFEKSTYANGDKEITTTAAVPVELTMPMVGPNGVVTDAHVYPKNTDDTPQVDKDFEEGFDETNNDDITIENKDDLTHTDPKNPITGPDYQNYQGTKAEITTLVGKEVPYAVKTLIPANAHYKNFVWEDIMTHGLTYQKNLKNGLKDDESQVLINGDSGTLQLFKIENKESNPTGETLAKGTDYTINETESGFNIELTDAGLKKINGRDEAVEIRMHYTAKINDSTIVEIPESNDIRVEFGRQPKQKHQEFTPDKDKISLKKTWAEGLPEKDKVTATFKLEKYDETNGWTTVEGYEAIVLNSENGWQKDNIPVEIGGKYRFTEVAIEGYTEEYVGYKDGVYTVKNYKETVEPKDGKLIIDKSYANGTTPADGDKFIFDLWRINEGSEKVVKTIEVTYSTTGNKFTVTAINGKAPAAGENNKLPYTFEGLEAGTYKLTERLSGYTAFPNVTEGTTTKAPKIQLENKKTNDNPEPKNPTEPKVKTGGKKFVKTDASNSNTRLAGAEFIVLRKKPGKEDGSLQYLTLKDNDTVVNDQSAYTKAKKAYYAAYADRNKLDELATAKTIDTKAVQAIYDKYTDELTALNLPKPDNATKEGIKAVIALFDQKEDKSKEPAVKAGILQQLERARDAAFKNANFNYAWVDVAADKKNSRDGNDFPNAYRLISDWEGRFEVKGLTFNKGQEKYILREVKAPEGYALMTSDDEFVIKAGSYKGTDTEVQYNKDDTNDGYGQRVDNKKLTIPPTGGIGTIIFTVAGLALMAIAIIAISKKRSDDLLEEK